MIGCIGRDFMGAAQLKSLSAEGIVTDYIVRHERLKTGVVLIYVDGNGQNKIMIASNANAACSMEQLDETIHAFTDSTVFLTQLETNLDPVLYAMEKTQKAGCKVILDPAPVQAVPPEIWAMADIVKPNENEAAYYTGMPIDENDIQGWAGMACKKLRAMGAPAALIMLGAKGCRYSGEGEFYLPAINRKAIDATAAGDSFAGALAVALGEGRVIRQAVAVASAAGRSQFQGQGHRFP